MDAQDSPAKVESGSFGGFNDAAYEDVVKYVVDGYNAIVGALDEEKRVGVIPKGRLLCEMITSPDWNPPPLLSDEKYAMFRRATDQYLLEGSLWLIFHILEHECGEMQLLPSIKIDRKTGHLVVVLSL